MKTTSKYKLKSYWEDKETDEKMVRLLPKQKTSLFIRKLTKAGIKVYEKNKTL